MIMSFEDIESGNVSLIRINYNGRRQEHQLGGGRPSSSSSSHRHHHESTVAAVFKINTAVASFQRLVNSLGTPKDTLDLRLKLQKTRLHIGQLVKETTAKLKQDTVTHDHHMNDISPAKKIADAKLAKDFQSVLREFQKAQRLAAERETSYAPSLQKQLLPSRNTASELDILSSRKPEQMSLLVEPRSREALVLENEIVFNEAMIEEREQGIQEIQQQIGEVNGIFKDLAVLVHEQRALIDDISSNIENSHASTVQATSELTKASKYQKSTSSMMCLLLLIFGIILVIVIILVIA